MTTETDEDALDGALRELPRYDLEPERSAQILRRARGVFVARAEIASRPSWLRTLTRVYEVGLEPALVVCATVVYLGWAIRWIITPH